MVHIQVLYLSPRLVEYRTVIFHHLKNQFDTYNYIDGYSYKNQGTLDSLDRNGRLDHYLTMGECSLPPSYMCSSKRWKLVRGECETRPENMVIEKGNTVLFDST